MKTTIEDIHREQLDLDRLKPAGVKVKPLEWVEHECIWLAPHSEDERTWCCDDVYEGDGVKYVLASRLSDAEARIEELEAALAEADALIEAQQHDFARNNIRNAENEHRAKAAEALLKEAVEALALFSIDGRRRAACAIAEKMGGKKP